MVPRRDGGRIGFEGVEGGGGGWGGGEGASDNARPVFAFATLAKLKDRAVRQPHQQREQLDKQPHSEQAASGAVVP